MTLDIALPILVDLDGSARVAFGFPLSPDVHQLELDAVGVREEDRASNSGRGGAVSGDDCGLGSTSAGPAWYENGTGSRGSDER